MGFLLLACISQLRLKEECKIVWCIVPFSDTTMTAIKHTLQREVFLPAEERLVAVVHVTKAGKKKKSSFLCAAGMISKHLHFAFTIN